MPPRVPDKPSLDGLEQRWSDRWESDGTYRFAGSRPRPEVFAIDTPPPTVSGSLHVGHVLSYTHTDTVARFRRMQGRDVFYPMGWDDNGVPTERRVQNHFGVRCDPSIAYDPDFVAPARPAREQVAISRPNFVELCRRLTAEDEQVFEQVWRRLGLSVDWSRTYTTIGEAARRASQRGFLRLVARGQAYQAEAPTLWDVDFATAVAQAELEDRDVPGAYHRLRFAGPGDRPVEIETTRPELLAACVALVAHPDDGRYQSLFGSEVVTPLFRVRVPVLAHPLADPEKGSGVAMICTFGDVTDVIWWRELDLPVRAVLGRRGRLLPVEWGAPGWATTDPAGAGRAYSELEGLAVKAARARTVELLRQSGDLVGEPRPITHPVKFYERGERPLEIVTSRQWFIRTLDLRPQLEARGRELRWHPPFMRARYESWVEGLNNDWSISRQRFFGVPFPVWYALDADGRPDHDRPLLAGEDDLPVDPSTDAPGGYAPDQRGEPGGFVADPDVMDTWATSSLTPQIAGGWVDDPDLFARVFPMDLRPQAHEIIRTWLFSTVVRSHLEHDRLPWSDAAISGWVVDPERKKMSKSRGNVVTPMDILERHGSDAVRYWAASGRPGSDTTFDEAQIKIGRRLAIKILNASRFVLSRMGGSAAGNGAPPVAPATANASAVSDGGLLPLDAGILHSLAGVVTDATAAFEAYDYSKALSRTESFFWGFCDDYLELVKGRAYGTQGEGPRASAEAALAQAMSVQLRLFAPFLPFVTEEVWSWWKEGSVHRTPWPTPGELLAPGITAPDGPVLEVTSEVLAAVRRAKTEAKRSMRWPVTGLAVTDAPARLSALASAQADLLEAAVGETVSLREGSELSVAVVLGQPPSSTEAAER